MKFGISWLVIISMLAGSLNAESSQCMLFARPAPCSFVSISFIQATEDNKIHRCPETKLPINVVQDISLLRRINTGELTILGGYNLYVKRASFKDDVLFKQILDERPDGIATATPVIEERIPIAADETEQELTNEERQKREEFKSKRRALALEGADGLDLKAVLSNRAAVHGEELDEEDGEGHKSENDDSVESQEEEVKICVTDHDKQSEINRPSIS